MDILIFLTTGRRSVSRVASARVRSLAGAVCSVVRTWAVNFRPLPRIAPVTGVDSLTGLLRVAIRSLRCMLTGGSEC